MTGGFTSERIDWRRRLSLGWWRRRWRKLGWRVRNWAYEQEDGKGYAESAGPVKRPARPLHVHSQRRHRFCPVTRSRVLVCSVGPHCAMIMGLLHNDSGDMG